MTAAITARGLGKRYRRRWALSDCTLDIPAGRVTGLVGPNGAGKSTLLGLAAGLLAPTAGTVRACGGRPGSGPAQLARTGFVAQDTPLYARLTVADHLRLGARLSPRWDRPLADRRVRQLGLPPGQRAGALSGGQRAQLALTLAVARRPELLILDEPVASLDPLARRAFLADVAELTADRELTVVHSSHLVADLEQVCDYLVILVASRLRLAGEVPGLLAAHHVLTGPPGGLPPGLAVVGAAAGGLLARGPLAPAPQAGATVRPARLDDLVLGYLAAADLGPPAAVPVLEARP